MLKWKRWRSNVMCVWGHYYPEEFDEDCSYCVDLKEEIQKEEKKDD